MGIRVFTKEEEALRIGMLPTGATLNKKNLIIKTE